jgi:hypothetical protein
MHMICFDRAARDNFVGVCSDRTRYMGMGLQH